MEGRGRSRARKKRRYASPKRLLSFLLTAAMVLTNMGPDLSLAYAATATDVTFEMEGADLVQSVEDAIAEGNEVEKGDIDFTEGAVDKFENLSLAKGSCMKPIQKWKEAMQRQSCVCLCGCPRMQMIRI